MKDSRPDHVSAGFMIMFCAWQQSSVSGQYIHNENRVGDNQHVIREDRGILISLQAFDLKAERDI